MKKIKLAVVAILVLLGAIFSHEVDAAQFVSGPNTYTASLNKSAYAPGESIVVNGSVAPASTIWVATLNVTVNNSTVTVVNYRSVSCAGVACGPNPTVPNGSVTMTAPSAPGTYTALFSGSGDYFRQNIYTIVAANFVNYAITYTVVPPPTCTLSYSPAGPLTAPGSTTATWSSTNATSGTYSCTGPVPGSGSIATSGSTVWSNMSAGTQSCTINVTGPGGTGTCGRSIVINSTPVNGSCGTANGRVYSSADTNWGTYAQCASGTPSTTAFPAVGNSTVWTCNGANGGTNSTTCTASRAAYVCTNIPTNATPIAGDNTGLVANTLSTVVTANTAAKCEYTCNTNYGKVGNTCAELPYCLASFSPAGPLTDPGNSTLSWNAQFADSSTLSCTGPIAFTNLNVASAGSLPFNNMSTGQEACRVDVKNSAGSRACFAAININAPATTTGVCGSATTTGPLSSPPTTNLCSVGTPSAVTSNATSYLWTCTGTNNTPVGCSVARDCGIAQAPFSCVYSSCSTCGTNSTGTCSGINTCGATVVADPSNCNSGSGCPAVACPACPPERNANWREVSPN